MFEYERRLTPGLDEIQREMERYLQHMAQKKPRVVVFSQRRWQPAADVYETEDSVVALFELAGVSDREIDLIVTRNSLTLRGERKESGERTERRYSSLELPFGPFERIVPLPAPVNPDAARADFKSGFLQVTMPKATPAGPRRVMVNES
jgi:HSP20 family protein